MSKKKNYFFGKYYKFITKDGFAFAIIHATSNEGEHFQYIDRNGSHQIEDVNSIKVNEKDSYIEFNVRQANLSLIGKISLGSLNPLRKPVMGPFRHFKMQCTHEVYSMHHDIEGKVSINDQLLSFDNGVGYIEGDAGTSFPSKYIWYNSITDKASVTLAIATIPMFKRIINFTGLLCFIKDRVNNKEYYICTYNGGKIVHKDETSIIVKKGKLSFEVNFNIKDANKLKAPVQGDMSRYIKENISTPSKYVLRNKKIIIMSNNDPISSLEFEY